MTHHHAQLIHNNRLKRFARKALPSSVWQLIRCAFQRVEHLHAAWRLRRLRLRLQAIPPNANRMQRMDHYTICVNHGPICYYLYEDIFINKIYHFQANKPNPLIIDCGSNMGMSILYFKNVYPQSRIIGFEPDRDVFPYLRKNIELNRLSDVMVYQAAVASKKGTMQLLSHDMIGSSLSNHVAKDIPSQRVEYTVSTVRLRDYLTDPVDFLKINIEGAEWEVLKDSDDHLRQVREMVIEYHHLPGLPRTLHNILDLLHGCGFEYIVSDFGLASYGDVRPPVNLTPQTRYFRHVYARRID